MGYEIVWTPTALRTFQKNIDYLEEHWTEREIISFEPGHQMCWTHFLTPRLFFANPIKSKTHALA